MDFILLFMKCVQYALHFYKNEYSFSLKYVTNKMLLFIS